MMYRGIEIEIQRRGDNWYWAVGEEPFEGPCYSIGAALGAARENIDRAHGLDIADQRYQDAIDRALGYLD